MRNPRLRRKKTRVPHPQRLKDEPLRVFVQRHPRELLHQRAQHNKVDVAVDEFHSRRARRRDRKRHLISRPFAFPRLRQWQIRRQSGVVRQQLPNRDVLFPIRSERRQILRHRIVELKVPPLIQLHRAVVVARHFVSDAMSKIVSTVIASRVGSSDRIPYALRKTTRPS